MDQDLNTKMANYAATCAARADAHRREAAETRAQPKSGWDDYDRAQDDAARGHDAQAARWDVRAGNARAGRMAVYSDAEGIARQLEYQDLHSLAAAEHRSVQLDGNDRPM